MLSWSVFSLVVVLVAALFGFSGLVGNATGIARGLFVISLVAFIFPLFLGRVSSV